MGLSWDAQVSDIIRDGSWVFPSGSAYLQHIWVFVTVQPLMSLPDHFVWKGYSFDRFSIDLAWNVLQDRWDVNVIHHLFLFPGHVSRHSFILWLVSLGWLRTMDPLSSHGVIASSMCVLCRFATETHDQLFFSSDFSCYVWRNITAITLFAWPSFSWFILL